MYATQAAFELPSEQALLNLPTRLATTRDRVLGSNAGASSQGSKTSAFPRTTTQEMHNAE